jgi:dodecin
VNAADPHLRGWHRCCIKNGQEHEERREPATQERQAMSVAKTIEISADSPNSFEEAVQEGVRRAGSSLEHVQRAWIKDQIVLMNEGKIEGYRVHMEVTFRLNE